MSLFIPVTDYDELGDVCVWGNFKSSLPDLFDVVFDPGERGLGSALVGAQ